MSKQNTAISDDDWRIGLFYILKNETGYMDALKVINEKLADRLLGIGAIGLGLDGAGHSRYHVTDWGYQYAFLTYVELCRKKREQELKS